MRVLRGPWLGWPRVEGRSSLTIGVLDGVHKGHRALLSRLDPTMVPTVLTFEPHPVEVLQPGTPPRLITTIDERIELLDAAGVERVGVLDLAEIKELPPEEFVQSVLLERLDTGHLVVGDDFRFGRDRSGDVELLKTLGTRLGFNTVSIELIDEGEEAVSSSRIRRLIEAGRVSQAAHLLGSPFRITNTVVDGDKRGSDIGFPTANLRPPDRKVIPATGIYACFVLVGDRRYDAAVSVGVRPTFGGGELLIEAFILDFEGNLYGEQITVEFVEYTRPELAFDGVDELVDQMNEDVSRVRAILETARSRI
ncbi:MAG: bifunctional riboflavin kinase/FAD synthetase [Actinomycetota bacterium]